VTRYLLDTNIISNATKPAPSASLIEWLTGQPDPKVRTGCLLVALAADLAAIST
jgi:predicted nucleic acid-binding protein